MMIYFEFNEKLVLKYGWIVYVIASYLLSPFMLRMFASWAKPILPGVLAWFWIFSPITFPFMVGGYIIYIIDTTLRIGL